MNQKLIELINNKNIEYVEFCTEMALSGNYDIPSLGEYISNSILKDGWKKFPCKVGDKIYVLSSEKIIQTEVFKIQYEEEAENYSKFVRERIYAVINNVLEMFDFSDFGKIIFLSEKEAKQALLV